MPAPPKVNGTAKDAPGRQILVTGEVWASIFEIPVRLGCLFLAAIVVALVAGLRMINRAVIPDFQS